MFVTFTTINGRELILSCTLDQFLAGPVMSHLAAIQNNCDPAEIVKDYLPSDLECHDPDDVLGYVAEACLQATRYEPAGVAEPMEFREVIGIELEEDDLVNVQVRFCQREPILFLVSYDPQPAA